MYKEYILKNGFDRYIIFTSNHLPQIVNRILKCVCVCVCMCRAREKNIQASVQDQCRLRLSVPHLKLLQSHNGSIAK